MRPCSQRRSGTRVKFLLIALLGGCSFGVPAIAQQQAADTGLQETVLDFVVNADENSQSLVVLRDKGSGLWLEGDDYAHLRLNLPPVAPYRQHGKAYFPLQAIPGAEVRIDESRQRVTVTVPAQALESTRISAPPRRSTPITRAELGAFLNYQFSGQRIGTQNVSGASAELGIFGSQGVATNTMLARDSGALRSAVRLDSTFTHDFVDSMQTLNVGDAISDPGAWGSAVRFGGIRFSRNFAIRPDLLTTPLLSAGGNATVPSTVDVFVNNQRVSSSQLPPGPFVIDNLPTVTGTGDVRVVVTDALGRTQVVTKSFYSGVGLLAQGLSQYSVDLGKLRADYTIASNRYDNLIGSATYRRGLNDTWTAEVHGEFEHGGPHAAGFNVAHQVGNFGIVNVTTATGGDVFGSGMLAGVGFEHRGSGSSFLLNTQVASHGYAHLGDTSNLATRVREQTTAQVGRDFGRYGALSVAYVRQGYEAQASQQTFTLSDNLQVGRRGYFSASISRSSGTPGSTSVYLLYTMALSAGRAAPLSGLGGSGPSAPRNALAAGMMQNPPLGAGTGWRVEGASSGSYDLDLRHQFQAGDFEVQAARNDGISGQSAFVSGAATLLDGELRFARQVPGSFAVVEVGDVAGVPIYVDNQLMTHTNAAGRALVPNLRPFEDNRISVDPLDLPLDTSIGSRLVVLAPGYRTGVVARFPIERIKSATLRLVLPDGSPVPVGAMVRFKDKVFPVVRGGVVYLTGIDHSQSAEASWGESQCTFRIPALPAHDAMPDLGNLTCRADRRPGHTTDATP